MSKVIEPSYKFKPIKCSVCGCTYEFEKGDKIEMESVAYGDRQYLISRTLTCPVCGNENTLEVEGEEENEK